VQRNGIRRQLASIIILTICVLAALLDLSYFSNAAAAEPSQVQSVQQQPAVGLYSLIDHHGRKAREENLRDRYLLVYFGYTFCPDICPTDLMTISEALDSLGAAGEIVVPVFVTVDPERDTAKVMADYVENFHPRLLGLTGTSEKIAEVARAFGVRYFKVFQPPFLEEAEGGDEEEENDNNLDYSVSHSALTYLIGQHGRILVTFPHGMNSGEMKKELRFFVHQ